MDERERPIVPGDRVYETCQIHANQWWLNRPLRVYTVVAPSEVVGEGFLSGDRDWIAKHGVQCSEARWCQECDRIIIERDGLRYRVKRDSVRRTDLPDGIWLIPHGEDPGTREPFMFADLREFEAHYA